MRRALSLALLVVLSGPGVAEAAPIGAVFAGTAAPVACTTQASGQRLCSGAPSTVPSWDGTPIDVSVALPPAPRDRPDGAFPVVGIFHGWGDLKEPLSTDPDSRVQHWLARGYAVFTMTARGWGASCGAPVGEPKPAACAAGYTRWMHTAFEVRDAQHLLGLLADEGVIAPKAIAATGGSYGGAMALQLGTLRTRTRLPSGALVPWRSPGGLDMAVAATSPEFTWSDLPAAFLPNGTTLDYLASSPYRGPGGDRGIGVDRWSWTAPLFSAGERDAFYAPRGADPAGDLRGWRALADRGAPYDAEAQRLVAGMSADHSALGIDDDLAPAPTLLAAGWNDDLVGVEELVRWYNRVREHHPSTPVSLFAMDFGHYPRASLYRDDVAQLRARQRAWFDAYVREQAPEPTSARGGVDVIASRCPPSGAGPVLHAPTWAELSPGEVRHVDLTARTIAAVTTAASNDFSAARICDETSSARNGSAATYETEPAAETFTIAGAPTVLVETVVSRPEDQVAARLYDVDPATGRQRLIGRQAVRPAGAGEGLSLQVFQLSAQAWRVLPGHRIRLELLASDTPLVRPAAGQMPIAVRSLELRLPVLEPPGVAAGVAAPAPIVLPAGGVLARDLRELRAAGAVEPGSAVDRPPTVAAPPASAPAPASSSAPPPPLARRRVDVAALAARLRRQRVGRLRVDRRRGRVRFVDVLPASGVVRYKLRLHAGRRRTSLSAARASITAGRRVRVSMLVGRAGRRALRRHPRGRLVLHTRLRLAAGGPDVVVARTIRR